MGEGRLNAADANLDVIPYVYYPVIKILRKENGKNNEYFFDNIIRIFDGDTSTEIASFAISDFVMQSKKLFDSLKKAKGASFSFPEIEEFLNLINIKTLKASSSDKSDIKIVVHDINTGTKPTLGFSIKSMLGKNSTLFNPGDNTNFVYQVFNLPLEHLVKINLIEDKPKIANRIKTIRELGGQIKFVDTKSNKLKLNLQLIDSDLPKILAELLLIKYSNSGVSTLAWLVKTINNKNPLNFDLSFGHPFYEYKIKNFLTDSALGMTPASIWTGKYDATGGIIIVKEDGELVCYHIYNRNEFQEYLLNNTRLEQASTGRYAFGDLYEQDNQIFFNLNLQVRFN
ncbi:MAG: Type restriction endonuclease HpaII [Bacteroidota bacterium]